MTLDGSGHPGLPLGTMPHDKNGNLLQAGDVVDVQCTIKEVTAICTSLLLYYQYIYLLIINIILSIFAYLISKLLR